jgi:hypothetical protein
MYVVVLCFSACEHFVEAKVDVAAGSGIGTCRAVAGNRVSASSCRQSRWNNE